MKLSNSILAIVTFALANVASASYYGEVVPVESGGTGQESLTSNAFLIGNGTGNVSFLAPAANTVVTFGTGGAPTALVGAANEVVLFDGAGEVDSAQIADANIASGATIDTTKLANGSVSNTEFQYLDGATGNIQVQINAIAAGSGFANTSLSNLSGVSFNADLVPDSNGIRAVGSSTNLISTVFTQNLSTGGNGPIDIQSDLAAASGVNFTLADDYTASMAVVLDGSRNLISSAVTATELGYVSGVTSALQTQLNGKATIASVTAKVNRSGDTMSGGLGLDYAGANVSTALILDSSRKIVSSAVTSTELGYLTGATSNIQGQINAIAMASPSIVVVDNAASPYSAAFGQFILCDSSGGNVTVTAPVVSAGNSGMSFDVKKVVAGNSCIVNPGSGNAIDGLAGVTTTTLNQNRTVTSGGLALGGTNLYIR